MARIASWPLIEAAVAVEAPAHVDDRDVEVVDVADQVDRLLAAARLLHLEPIREHLANPEPDQRVIVDHKAVWALAQDCFRSLVEGFGAARISAAPLGFRS